MVPRVPWNPTFCQTNSSKQPHNSTKHSGQFYFSKILHCNLRSTVFLCYAITLRYKARASIFLFHLFRNLVYSCFGSCTGCFAYLEIRLNAVSQQLFWKLHRNKMSMAGSRKRPSAQSIIFKFIGKHTDTLHNAVNLTISTCRFRASMRRPRKHQNTPQSISFSKIFWGGMPPDPPRKGELCPYTTYGKTLF